VLTPIHFNNERQDYSIQCVCPYLWEVNEGDEGEGIWLMDVIYLYEIEQRHLLQLL
jgi:hypothetical protein